MAEITEVKPVMHSGLSNKKQTLGVALAVVVAFLIIMLTKNRNTSNTAATTSTANSDTATTSNDDVATVTDYFNQKLETNNEQFNEYANSVNTALKAIQEDYTGSISDLKSQIKTEDSTNYVDLKSSVSDLKNDVQDISNQVNVKTQVTKNKSTKVSSAGLGNNGVGTSAQIKANAEKVASNADFRKSEINRTVEVIQNRTNAGLSTSNQTEYLKQLTSYND